MKTFYVKIIQFPYTPVGPGKTEPRFEGIIEISNDKFQELLSTVENHEITE